MQRRKGYEEARDPVLHVLPEGAWRYSRRAATEMGNSAAQPQGAELSLNYVATVVRTTALRIKWLPSDTVVALFGS